MLEEIKKLFGTKAELIAEDPLRQRRGEMIQGFTVLAIAPAEFP
jgi:hypothetical protein